MWWSKKIIYLVRHGQSANNASKTRQGSAGGLSELGQMQARKVGERFTATNINVIIASPYERAQETAHLINETLGVPIETSELLMERKNPSAIVGKDADSEEVKKIIDVIDRSFHDPNMRYTDEENFTDLRERAKVLLKFLSNRKEKHIMCVSHRIFMKMVISYIESGEELSAEEFVRLDFLNPINNGTVSICEYTPLNKLMGKKVWKLLLFNNTGAVGE